jgi:hypothetical protein
MLKAYNGGLVWSSKPLLSFRSNPVQQLIHDLARCIRQCFCEIAASTKWVSWPCGTTVSRDVEGKTKRETREHQVSSKSLTLTAKLKSNCLPKFKYLEQRSHLHRRLTCHFHASFGGGCLSLQSPVSNTASPVKENIDKANIVLMSIPNVEVTKEDYFRLIFLWNAFVYTHPNLLPELSCSVESASISLFVSIHFKKVKYS